VDGKKNWETGLVEKDAFGCGGDDCGVGDDNNVEDEEDVNDNFDCCCFCFDDSNDGFLMLCFLVLFFMLVHCCGLCDSGDEGDDGDDGSFDVVFAFLDTEATIDNPTDCNRLKEDDRAFLYSGLIFFKNVD
jgi:hypothetical protein